MPTPSPSKPSESPKESPLTADIDVHVIVRNLMQKKRRRFPRHPKKSVEDSRVLAPAGDLVEGGLCGVEEGLGLDELPASGNVSRVRKRLQTMV